MELKNIHSDIISATDIGLVREVNEDSCGVTETPNGTLCIVCDGMGGHVGGEEASRIAVSCIIQYFNKEVYPNIRQALKDALDFANLQIIGTALENPELEGMGTTACVLLIQNDQVWIAHAGDSRIYLYAAKEKQLHRLTKDHSYVQGLIEQGIISEDEEEKHPYKNRILKALGIKEELQSEIVKESILPAKNDIFLICSDGLSTMVSDKQIQAILSSKTNLQEKETALMSAAKNAGGLDNITFQLIRIGKSPHKQSEFESKNLFASKENKKHNLLKYILFIIAILFLFASVFLITRKSNRTELDLPMIPADSTIIINQQDSILEKDTLQLHL